MLEALTQVVVGYICVFLTNILVFPLFGIHVSIQDNALIVLITSFVAFIKAYMVRRYFAKVGADKTAGE